MSGSMLPRKEYEDYIKTFPKEYCPFCDIQKQIVLDESKFWFWIANISPYWRYHTLFVPKKCIKTLDQVSADEFLDYQEFHKKILKHILNLDLKHLDGKPIDQFITMIRERIENIPNGSKYYKPNHLHIHFVPDREGVERFVLDKNAVDIDIKRISI